MDNQRIFLKVRDEYAQRRAENEAERDRRTLEAYARDPELEGLHRRSAGLVADTIRRVMANPAHSGNAIEQMREEGTRMTEEIATRLIRLGYPADYLEGPFRCPKCRDTGYVGNLNNEMCDCMKRRIAEIRDEESGLPELKEQNFETFDLSIFPDAVGENARFSPRTQMAAMREQLEAYADSFPQTQKRNVVLMGTSGQGKTFLLNCIAQRVLHRGGSVLRVSAYKMFEAMRQRHFGSAESGHDGLDDLIEAELLLIDDLGTEPMMRNVTIEYLFTLLNERISCRRHTVIATNLSPTDLSARYNERVVSRLLDAGNALLYRLTGPDLRKRKA